MASAASSLSSRKLLPTSTVRSKQLLSTFRSTTVWLQPSTRRSTLRSCTSRSAVHNLHRQGGDLIRLEAASLVKAIPQRANAISIYHLKSRLPNGQRPQQSRCLADSAKKGPDGQKEKKPFPLNALLPSHENIYTLPNILTFSRLLCAPVIGYLVVHDLHLPALGLFLYAGVTDLVDGWIARRWGLQTVIGTVIDPMADKALMTVVTVCLAWKEVLPVSLATLILGRDILLGISALYYRFISLPPPLTITRFWDFSLPSAEVRPTTISKINTFLQLALIGATMGGTAMGGLGETGQSALEVSWWVVGATTVWSGASYVWGGTGVRILGKKGIKGG